MKATEVKLPSFLQKSPQFIVPIYHVLTRERTSTAGSNHGTTSSVSGPAPGLRYTSSVPSCTDQPRCAVNRGLDPSVRLRPSGFPCTGRTSVNLMPRSPDGMFGGIIPVTCHAKNFAHCGIDIVDPRTIYNGERLSLMK